MGISPKQLTDEVHEKVVELFRRWGISFDNYTRTESPVHKEFVRTAFSKIYERGYVFVDEAELPYCERCERFLPDRFVEGKCPFCGYEGARGDQCEACERLLEPTALVDPYCSICRSTPTVRRTKHWYFDLPKFSKQLYDYVKGNERLPDNARGLSLAMIEEGLRPRPITRDAKWGISAPFPGAEGKTLYVWVEAVLGYASATVEHFKRLGEEERWKGFWLDEGSKAFYFIGKDNIPFHTLILPALLLATGDGYNLPWNVSSTEFLLWEGQKFSKSRRIGVWIDEALELFPADYWRYVLLAARPETKDVNFTWKLFIEKVNSDLNDTLGNFVHRTLTFINNYFEGKIPKYELNEEDEKMLKLIERELQDVADDIERCKIQEALRHAINLSRIGNQFLNEREPWKLIKVDRQKAANALYVATQIVKASAIALEPFIPFTSEEIWRLLNLPGDVHKRRWGEALDPLPPGHEVKKAKPLFHKVEEDEEGLQRMLEAARAKPQALPFKEFAKLDIRVGKVLKAERIPGSRSLLKLLIDIGEEELRQAVAGIAQHYEPSDLEGKDVVVIVNLEPKKIFGVTSEVMILAAEDEGIISIIRPDKAVRAGSKIR